MEKPLLKKIQSVILLLFSLTTTLYNWQIRLLQSGRETGPGHSKCVRQPAAGPMSGGQSAMNTRKASTSSMASSIGAFSYFSIDTSEKEEPQQSGTMNHFLLSLHKKSNIKWLSNHSLIHLFTSWELPFLGNP